MPTKCTTPISAIDKYIKQQCERREKALFNLLCYAGERCVNEARSYHGRTYTDRTGNLRSSIGYVVVINGEIRQMGGFEVILSGAEGAQNGKNLALEVAGRYPHETVLIVVAGRTYARNVAARGFNVLQSAEQLAESLMPTLLRGLSAA